MSINPLLVIGGTVAALAAGTWLFGSSDKQVALEDQSAVSGILNPDSAVGAELVDEGGDILESMMWGMVGGQVGNWMFGGSKSSTNNYYVTQPSTTVSPYTRSYPKATVPPKAVPKVAPKPQPKFMPSRVPKVSVPKVSVPKVRMPSIRIRTR